MFGTNLRTIIGGVLNLILLTGALLYAGLVAINFNALNSRVRPQVNLRDPAQSAQKLAVWLGVMTLATGIRVATPVLAMLSEASADVGDWFLSHRRRQTR